MTCEIPCRDKLAVLLAAAAVVAIGFGATPASAQNTQYDRDGRPTYGSRGPNVSYMQGPRTRVYVTKRSWLDAGTEVLPGDRKFQDYAFPPEYRLSVVRPREQQSPDRPPAAQPAVGSRRISDAISDSVLIERTASSRP